jgi:hypothetical protein
MAPPLLPALAPALQCQDTRSIVDHGIKPMKLVEEQNSWEQHREEYYALHHNYNEPWFNNTDQRPMELPTIPPGDFPTSPIFAWDWGSNLNYYRTTTASKLEFKESHSQPHSPFANNAIGSTPSASSSSSNSSRQLSPVPKLESPTTSTVELAGTQMASAQAAFNYPFLPIPNTSIWKGISFCQPDQKQFGNPFHPGQHHHKDSFACLLNASLGFS